MKNFDDWNNLFCAKAAAFEKEGNTDYAMGLYRAAEFFNNPSDPNKKVVFEKPVAAVLDYLGADNITLIGMSLGGI